MRGQKGKKREKNRSPGKQPKKPKTIRIGGIAVGLVYPEDQARPRRLGLTGQRGTREEKNRRYVANPDVTKTNTGSRDHTSEKQWEGGAQKWVSIKQ